MMPHRLRPSLLFPFLRRLLGDIPPAPVVWLALLAACGSVLTPTRHALALWNARETPSWVGALPGTPQAAEPAARVCDLDTRLIHNGLLAAPRFRDTLRWWSGTWVGQVPFYRPLTSWLFWGEWKLFGDHEARYTLAGIGVYLLAVWQFARFARAIVQHYDCPRPGWTTLLAAGLFLDGWGLILAQLAVNADVLAFWKNQPDPLCGIFAFQFGIAYLQWMDRDARALSSPRQGVAASSPPSPPQNGPPAQAGQRVYARLRQWAAEHSGYAAVACVLLACACKEAAVLLPLLALWLEAPGLLRREAAAWRCARRRLVPTLSVLPLFLLWRAHCLHTVSGFHYGSNGSWPRHFAANFGGLISSKIARGAWYELLPGLTLYGTGLLLRRRSRQRGGWTRIGLLEWVAWALGALVCMDVLGLLAARGEGAQAQDAAVVLLRYATPSGWYNALLVFVFVGSIHHLALRRAALGVFAYGWNVLILIPTLFSPPMPHRYYLMNAGYALLIGAGLACWSSPDTASATRAATKE